MSDETYINANLNHEVVIELPSNDSGQNCLILFVTTDGIKFNFYNDGEITGTMYRTYQEWREEAESAFTSRSNHPTNWKVNKENAL
jgi:hypothetical protein